MPSRRLSPAAPIDLGATLAPLRTGRGDPTVRIDHTGFWRALRTPDGPASQHLWCDGGDVVVEAWGDGAAWTLEAAAELVGLDDDPAGYTPAHTVLVELHRRHPGLRLGRSNAPTDLLVRTILEQKVTGREAKRAWAALVRAAGEPAPGPAGLLVPPDPAWVATVPYTTFHRWGVERKRADTIRFACARAVRVEETAAMTHAEAWQRLTAFPGVGPWTAGIVLRVALGDRDAIEVGDFHLPNLVAWNLAGEVRGDDDRMLELLAPEAGQRGRALRLLELGGRHAPKFGPRMALRDLAAI